MHVDLTQVTDAALTVASAAITSGAAFAARLAVRKLKLAADSAMARQIDALFSDAAGLAYTVLMNCAAKPHGVEISNAAIAAGLQHVNDAAPGLLTQAGITPEVAAAKVTAALGKLLATDPTVTPGATPAVLPLAIVTPAADLLHDPAPAPSPAAPVAAAPGA